MLSVSGTMACGSSTTAPALIATINYVSRIQEHGSAWRSFPVTTAGDVLVQLTSVTQTDAIMGLGLGTVNGSDCAVTQSVQTAANGTTSSPQITTSVPVGTYCVKLYDIGNLTTIVDFSITITKPY
jgi:hypothetical protein